eukprot:PhF_6_TR24770/c0_g1_i1/m.34009
MRKILTQPETKHVISTTVATMATSPTQQPTSPTSWFPHPSWAMKLPLEGISHTALPIDTDLAQHSRYVKNACFALVNPTPLDNPTLVARSGSALELIGIDPNAPSTELSTYFSGNVLLPGSTPVAHCYCGYQFGNFAGQLGDGAAMLLGTVVPPRRNPLHQRYELQLKGSGPTPFSRSFDGRKVLRSSIREFLGCEGMHGLGIPTTRSATCVTSTSTVIRDMHYNGNPQKEYCAVITRIAPTFFRFGSYEIVLPNGPSAGNYGLLWKMLEYTCKSFFPHLAVNWIQQPSDTVVSMFEEVMKLSASLAAQWQAIGFCHGVLNTDNMSIIGITLDYGPFGFVEAYDPDYVPNGSDTNGRYAFQKQPEIVKWNLKKLAECWGLVADGKKMADLVETQYDGLYEQEYVSRMQAKLGISGAKNMAADKVLIQDLLSVMQITGADYSDTFRYFSSFDSHTMDVSAIAEDIAIKRCAKVATLIESRKTKLRRMRINIPGAQIRQLVQLHKQNPDAFFMLFPNSDHSAVLTELRHEEDKLAKMEKIKAEIEKLEQVGPADKIVADTVHWKAWLLEYQKKNEGGDCKLQQGFFFVSASVLSSCDGLPYCKAEQNGICQSPIHLAQLGIARSHRLRREG